jgi:hypothetical protein
MIRDLFDEYKYFENYPEKELTLTAVLLGQLIHQQVPYLPFGSFPLFIIFLFYNENLFLDAA